MRSLHSAVFQLKLLTFLVTTTLQRCKLIYAFEGGLRGFGGTAACTILISSRTMSFPADSIGGNLRLPPLPKTRRNNSTSAAQKQPKRKIVTNCAAFSNAGFFRPHISSSCFYQLSRLFPNNNARANLFPKFAVKGVFTPEVLRTAESSHRHL